MSQEFVQLQKELADLEAKKAEVAAKLAAQREEVRTSLVESLRAHITTYGFQVEDIANAMLPKGRRTAVKGAKGTRKSSPATVYVDNETGNTYSKGRVPEWLRQGMLRVQLNPDDPKSIKEYKTSHMTVQAPVAAPVEAA